MGIIGKLARKTRHLVATRWVEEHVDSWVSYGTFFERKSVSGGWWSPPAIDMGLAIQYVCW
jgi:hypothetical protein